MLTGWTPSPSATTGATPRMLKLTGSLARSAESQTSCGTIHSTAIGTSITAMRRRVSGAVTSATTPATRIGASVASL